MRKAQEIANAHYRELCAQYGELQFKVKLMHIEIENLEKQMEGINASVPAMFKLEDELSKRDKGEKESE